MYSKGFTLLELLVVLVILGLLAACVGLSELGLSILANDLSHIFL